MPQWPQKGTDGSTGFVHRGQRVDATAGREGGEMRGAFGGGGGVSAGRSAAAPTLTLYDCGDLVCAGAAAPAAFGAFGPEVTGPPDLGVPVPVLGPAPAAVPGAVPAPAPVPELEPEAPLPPAAPTLAAEAVIGFPQSMQKREAASFARPQKEQVKRQTPRRELIMAGEYRRGGRGGQ